MKKTRNTRQRGVVLEILQQTTGHPTAEMIYNNARQAIPNISLGTVYRNLNFLQNQGLVREIRPFDGSSTRFDGILESHAHFHCMNCGIIIDLTLSNNLELFQPDKTDGISKISSINLNILGECSNCGSGDSIKTY